MSDGLRKLVKLIIDKSGRENSSVWAASNARILDKNGDFSISGKLSADFYLGILVSFVFIGNFNKSDKKDALMIAFCLRRHHMATTSTICLSAADNEHAKEAH